MRRVNIIYSIQEGGKILSTITIKASFSNTVNMEKNDCHRKSCQPNQSMATYVEAGLD